MPSLSDLVSALTNGHVAVSKADLYYGGSLIQRHLPISAGSVSVDSTRATKRTFSATVVDDTGSLIPKSSGDPLAPYGAELHVFRGALLDWSPYYWPVGFFRLATVDVVDDGSGPTIQVTGYDRSRAISLSRFTVAYTIAAGTDVLSAIADILSLSSVGMSVWMDVQTRTTGTVGAVRVIDAESDPWATIQSLATDIGCEAYFDTVGNCVVRDQPNPGSGSVVDTYEYGELSKFTKLTNSLTDDPGYNGVVVSGEAAGLPVYTSEMFDSDPSSPTYYLGPYGKRPYFYRSQYIYTQAQADSAAQGLYLSNTGITEQAKFEAIPNPTLDGGDIVEVTYDDLGVNDRFVIESLEMPLGPEDAMSVVCRKRRYV